MGTKGLSESPLLELKHLPRSVASSFLEGPRVWMPSSLPPQAEHPGMRTYVLAADTLEDLRGWLRALGRASRAEGDDW